MENLDDKGKRMKEGGAAKAQHEIIGVKDSQGYNHGFQRTQHLDAQWFENAGLGLFVHWGISSVHGGVDLSWGMMANTTWDESQKNQNKITPREYFDLANCFNPDKYDPDKWLKAAAQNGFKYAILTTKHHDGYTLWPSQYGELGVRTHLEGRDLVKPFVDACRKNGLKVGLYYSPPDWYFNRQYISFNFGSDENYNWEDSERFNGRPHYGLDHTPVSLPAKPEEWTEQYKAYIRGQVEELLSNYGKIDIIWFDGGPEAIPIGRIRELQPGIVVNPRMHGYGDYKTPECHMPKERIDGWWELCHIWNKGGWGYTKPEQYNSTEWLLAILAQTRSWGGNLLINCAPRPNGEMPDLYYERMEELSEWMKHSGESVIDVEAGPSSIKCTLPVTRRTNRWYVHFVNENQKTVVLEELKEPNCVVLLRTGESMEYKYDNGRLEVSISQKQRTGLDDVVCIVWGN